MHLDFWTIIYNPVFITVVISWFLAQFLKIFTPLPKEKKLKFSMFFSASGMPSSHTSMTMSATTMIGLVYGFDSPIFGLALVFSLIVMYDAAGVRYETGKQATIINFLMEEIREHNEIHMEKLKELIGHRPIEVLMGALLGIVVSVAYGFLVL
jgi:hypothetical protein